MTCNSSDISELQTIKSCSRVLFQFLCQRGSGGKEKHLHGSVTNRQFIYPYNKAIRFLKPTNVHIEELLERCKRGDSRAQLSIYQLYSKAMYNTALRIVKDTAEAEDIVQECFLKAFDKLETFKGTATFGAWLKKIVINHSLNVYRTQEKYQKILYCEHFKYAAEEPTGIIPEAAEQDEKVRKILNAMGDLKDSYRLALTLHLIEGYDYEEISEILKISASNCRTTISRAKESLRTKLLSYGN